jgi:hypothetical protein
MAAKREVHETKGKINPAGIGTERWSGDGNNNPKGNRL